MGKFLNFLTGNKTYITAGLSTIFGVLNLAGIPIPGVPALSHDGAVQVILGGLTAIFMRKGIEGVSASK